MDFLWEDSAQSVPLCLTARGFCQPKLIPLAVDYSEMIAYVGFPALGGFDPKFLADDDNFNNWSVNKSGTPHRTVLHPFQ